MNLSLIILILCFIFIYKHKHSKKHKDSTVCPKCGKKLTPILVNGKRICFFCTTELN